MKAKEIKILQQVMNQLHLFNRANLRMPFTNEPLARRNRKREFAIKIIEICSPIINSDTLFRKD